MQHSKTLSLNYSHCDTKCQFIAIEQGHKLLIEGDKN